MTQAHLKLAAKLSEKGKHLSLPSHSSPPLTRRGISALLTRAGNGLCRVKGIVHLTDGANGIARDAAAVVQYAGGQLQFEPAPKNNPDGDYLIFIGRDITPFTLRDTPTTPTATPFPTADTPSRMTP